MPSQDYVTAWQRHEAAVEEMTQELRDAGLSDHLGPRFELKPFTFAKAVRRSIIPRAGIVPRDLVARLDGEPFSLKVYWTRGVAHSSLFRSVAYAVLQKDGEPYIQVVMGAHDLPIPWLKDMQGPIDTTRPAGIHGAGAFMAAVKAAVSQHGETH